MNKNTLAKELYNYIIRYDPKDKLFEETMSIGLLTRNLNVYELEAIHNRLIKRGTSGVNFQYKISFKSTLTAKEKEIYNIWRKAIRNYEKDYSITSGAMNLTFIADISKRDNNNKIPKVSKVIYDTVMWLRDDIKYISKQDAKRIRSMSEKLAIKSKVKLIKIYIPEPMDKRMWLPGVRYTIKIK